MKCVILEILASVRLNSHKWSIHSIFTISCRISSFLPAEALTNFQSLNSSLIHSTKLQYLYKGWLHFIHQFTSLQSGEVNTSNDGILHPAHAARKRFAQILSFKSSSGQITWTYSSFISLSLFFTRCISSFTSFRFLTGSASSRKHASIIWFRYSSNDNHASFAIASVQYIHIVRENFHSLSFLSLKSRNFLFAWILFIILVGSIPSNSCKSESATTRILCVLDSILHLWYASGTKPSCSSDAFS